MTFYPRILLAGLMGLPAVDSLRHGDLWLSGSFAAAAAFVLAANGLFGETHKRQSVNAKRFRRRSGRASRMIVIGHRLPARSGYA